MCLVFSNAAGSIGGLLRLLAYEFSGHAHQLTTKSGRRLFYISVGRVCPKCFSLYTILSQFGQGNEGRLGSIPAPKLSPKKCQTPHDGWFQIT